MRTGTELLSGVTVTVNVTAPGTSDALDRAAIAASAGADALVMSPPTYFHHRDEEIVDAAFAGTGLPVIACDAPRHSNPITAAVLDGLLELPDVVGVEDSSGDLEWPGHLVDRARSRAGFAVSQGAETKLAAALCLGADGITPGLSLRLVDTHEAGDRDEVARLRDRITELTRPHTIRPGTPAVREVLAQRFLCPPYVALPLRQCTAAQSAELREFVSPHEDQLIHPMNGAAWVRS